MQPLDGIHHVTAITANAPQNLAFYTGVLGLRLLKKSVNQDDPSVYHLFYGDEAASPGSDLTFFEYPSAARGRAGDGMIHRIAFRVGSPSALDFWQSRLQSASIHSDRTDDSLAFQDPEGLGLELLAQPSADAPLVASHPEIPTQHALQGFAGVRAYSSLPDLSRPLLESTLGFAPSLADAFAISGASRSSFYAYDPAPSSPSRPGAGTVHHVAFASTLEDHPAWRQVLLQAHAYPSPIIDRFYFRSIYFREPSGVLFELATLGPGFTVDESLEHLGEHISLPPPLEHLRSQIEPHLTPLPNPRAAWPAA